MSVEMSAEMSVNKIRPLAEPSSSGGAQWIGRSGEKSLDYPVLEANWDIMLNSRHSKEAFERSCCGFPAVGRKIKHLRNLAIEITIAMPLLLFVFYVTSVFCFHFAT